MRKYLSLKESYIMSKIKHIHAREILDSRGLPTVEVDVLLDSGAFGRECVPSGASTGSKEALELRDGDPKRYQGRGVLKAVHNVNEIISKQIIGMDASRQECIDNALIMLDGTDNKSNLGANAILGVSLAVARAMSAHLNTPLYRYIGGVGRKILPTPMMNVINGGAHANNNLDIQEFMIIPKSPTSIREKIRCGAEIFHTLKQICNQNKYSTAVGDEGGFAPNLSSNEEALDLIITAITDAGYTPGLDVMLGIDCASSEFYRDGKYNLKSEGVSLTSHEFTAYLSNLVDKYPIISIEDGMSEGDITGWQYLTEKLGNKIQIVGDDVFVTNPKILAHGIKNNIANSLLVKVNQIGTLTETIEAVEMAKNASYTTIMSHRSGETESTIIADLSVALNCGQIKTGAMSRVDRTAKYNQLIRIEEELNLN